MATSILAFAAVIALLYFGRVFFITLLIAVITAFLLDPAVRLFMKLRLPRGVASFLVCSISLLFVYLLGLGLYTEALAMVEDLPEYSQRVSGIVDQVGSRVDQLERSAYETLVPKRYRETPPPDNTQTNAAPAARVKKRRGAATPPPQPQPQQPPAIQEVRIHRDPPPLYTYVYSYIRSFYNVALMASFIPFLVYFMLSWRDHLRRSFLYLFNAADRPIAGKSWEGVAEIARAYVLGNFLLGVFLGMLSATFFVVMRLPYAFIIGPISGFLSLVPYVGVPLAIIPPMIAALAIYTAADHLHHHCAGGDAASFDCAEPAVSEDGRFARAPESAGRHHRADVLGHSCGAGSACCSPSRSRPESKLSAIM